MCGCVAATHLLMVADADTDADADGGGVGWVDMKLVVAAVYTKFTTEIVDDEGIEQADSYISGPIGGKCVLRFKPV